MMLCRVLFFQLELPYFSNLLDTYSTHTRHLVDTYSTLIEHLLDTYSTLTRHLLDTYSTLTQHLLDTYSTLTQHLHDAKTETRKRNFLVILIFLVITSVYAFLLLKNIGGITRDQRHRTSSNSPFLAFRKTVFFLEHVAKKSRQPASSRDVGKHNVLESFFSFARASWTSSMTGMHYIVEECNKFIENELKGKNELCYL